MSPINRLVFPQRKAIAFYFILSSMALVSCNQNTVTSSSLPVTSSSDSSGSFEPSSSSASSSSAVFNGQDVPLWNLTNPEITEETRIVNTGLRQANFSRQEGDLYLASGLSAIQGVLDPNIGYETMVIYNLKTGEDELRFIFNPGQAYTDWAVSNQHGNNYSSLKFTVEGRVLYGSISLVIQHQSNRPESRLGGDYQPFVDAVDAAFSSIYPEPFQRYQYFYQFFFTYNLGNQSLIVRDVSNSYQHHLIELLAIDETLYAITRVNKGSEASNPYKTFPITSSAPDMTSVNQPYSIFYQLDLQDLSVTRSHAVGSTAVMYPYVESFRRDFEQVNLDQQGNLLLSFFFSFSVESRAEIASTLNAFNTTLLNGPDLSAFRTRSIAQVEQYYDVISRDVTIDSINFNVQFIGGYSFDFNGLTSFSVGSSFWYTAGLAETLYEGYVRIRYVEFDGVTYIIEIERIAKVLFADLDSYNSFYLPSVEQRSTILRLNLETRTKTQLLNYRNQGIYINGLFPHTDGFFLTGFYLDAPSNTSEGPDAFIFSLNRNFIKSDELILGGSNMDIGVDITLDQTGLPVWVVISDSTDGDFASMSGSNPNNDIKTYFVRFNE
jgi:hypothetical protein